MPYVIPASGEPHRHFRTASTSLDHKTVGPDCVTITNALSRQVYDHAKHTPEGEPEPAEGKGKLRLERYRSTGSLERVTAR